MPEIFRGIVEIKSIAREAGYRCKVAVWSRQEGVDPVGACVGLRGIRIQNVVNELNGERIDVVQWDPEPSRFVANALSPAQVVSVVTNDDDENTAEVVVPDRQLSLAIGKEGQNARLAAKLTGWRIDIKSQTAYEAELAAQGLTLGDGRRDGARRGAEALEGARRAGGRRGAHRRGRRAPLTPEEGDRARVRAARGSRQRPAVEEALAPAAAVVGAGCRRAAAPAARPGGPTIRFAEELVRPPLEALKPPERRRSARPAGRRRAERRGGPRWRRSRRRRAARAASCPSRTRKTKTTEYADLIR